MDGAGCSADDAYTTTPTAAGEIFTHTLSWGPNIFATTTNIFYYISVQLFIHYVILLLHSHSQISCSLDIKHKITTQHLIDTKLEPENWTTGNRER